MNTILLISDKIEIKPFLPVDKTTTISFEVLASITDICVDVILFYDLHIDLEKYSIIVESTKHSKGAVFGIDLDFSSDVKDVDVFEHIYQSDNALYNRTLELAMNYNVSLIPKITTSKSNDFIVGVVGNTDIIPKLPKYDNISYNDTCCTNVCLHGCDSVIISGEIDVKFMLAILTSCKPYIVYSEEEPRTLHNFLLNNVSWGQRVNINMSNNWWEQLYTRLQSATTSVRYPSPCVAILSDDEIITKVTSMYGIDITNWYYGRSRWNSEITDSLLFSQFICYWKSNRIDNDMVETLKYAIDNHASIDVSSLKLDGIPKQIIHPIIEKRPRVFINADPYMRDTYNTHRSGWKHVLKGLSTFERPYKQGLLFDTCVDRTFLWGKSVLASDNKIPYTQPWVGVIHHTFSSKCGPNNSSALFQTNEFIKSLDCCKGLIVMSEHLAKQMIESLSISHSHVSVDTVKHPTEFVNADKCFNPRLFDGTITHIGDFLRNKQAFVDVDVNTWEKQILINSHPEGGLSSTGILSVFGHASLRTLEKLNDNDYDTLLTKTVVFLNLFDVSACNTLVECIARKTPIIINNHPAVIEYIGADYPGLYSSLEEVPKLCTTHSVQKMYEYLNKMDMRTQLSLKTFLKSIESILFTNI